MVKIRSNFTLLIVLSIGILDVSARQSPPQGGQELTLEVKPTRSAYAKNDPVELDLTLRNVGKQQQVVARRLSLDIRIELNISDSLGKPLRRCGRISDELSVFRANYRTLAPGESMRTRLSISCNDPKYPTQGGYIFETAGKYRIEAAYYLPLPDKEYEKAFPGIRVVRGPVQAKSVTIDLK